jgi:hypothetical protein
MSAPIFLPLTTYREFSTQEMASRAKSFRDEMLRRRTVRQFSSRPVPLEVIEDCLSVARSAPSGANKQPWHFVVVSDIEAKVTFALPRRRRSVVSIVAARPKNGSMLLRHWVRTKTSPI